MEYDQARVLPKNTSGLALPGTQRKPTNPSPGRASSISTCLSEVHPEDEEVASVEVEVEPEREAVCQTSVQAAQCDLDADSMCEQVAAVFSSHTDHQQLC